MQTNRRPNILYICTGQQYFRMMSCTGNPYVSNPAMREYAGIESPPRFPGRSVRSLVQGGRVPERRRSI